MLTLPPQLAPHDVRFCQINVEYHHHHEEIKHKPQYFQTTNHNKNKKHNNCKMTTPFTLHDAQLSLVLAPSISPKP